MNKNLVYSITQNLLSLESSKRYINDTVFKKLIDKGEKVIEMRKKLQRDIMDEFILLFGSVDFFKEQETNENDLIIDFSPASESIQHEDKSVTTYDLTTSINRKEVLIIF